ncbi:MAG TPA: Vms1/Ankzf1 family peptidyl-tRNA hydrolase [Solirubrobacteraceae bacterium]|nr:Vms1/Ankzf1 family peptidyl-tRNA hydrolase [Solirubrobacteraceae bacterium]
MATTITRNRLRRLAEVKPERGRVLSVFLNLDPTEFATPAARSTAITSVLTKAAHRIDEAEGLEHDERVALREDVERVREALMAGDIAQNGTRAVAVYACKPADLLEVVRITRPVDFAVVLDRTPYLEPLAAEAHEERWCVLLVNRRNARFFVGEDSSGLDETDRVEDDVHSQHDQGGWSQARYQRGVEKEKDDHLVHVADVAFVAYKHRGFDRLLVGAPDELVGDLEHKLHPYLRERIAGRLHLDVENSSIDDVRGAAKTAIEAWRQRCEREALDRLAEGVGRGGRGAAGIASVLQALNEQRVETLLVGDGYRSEGGRDPETGMLFAGDHGPDGRELDRVENIVEPAIEKAIEQSARVIKVRHHDDLGPLGGIGAVLRY